MKAYLVVTGLLFGFLAAAHVMKALTHWDRLMAADPEIVVTGPGVGAITAILCLWACKLLRRAK